MLGAKRSGIYPHHKSIDARDIDARDISPRSDVLCTALLTRLDHGTRVSSTHTQRCHTILCSSGCLSQRRSRQHTVVLVSAVPATPTCGNPTASCDNYAQPTIAKPPCCSSARRDVCVCAGGWTLLLGPCVASTQAWLGASSREHGPVPSLHLSGFDRVILVPRLQAAGAAWLLLHRLFRRR